MPERVYMNRTPGEERIHVEIRADEIPALLADAAAHFDVSNETRVFVGILREAGARFGWDARMASEAGEAAPASVSAAGQDGGDT